MELYLRVEFSGPGSASTFADVVASVEESHSLGELAVALARYLGLPAGPEWTLSWAAPAKVFDAATPLSDIGLVSGSVVRLGSEHAAVVADRPAADFYVVVCSGPDVGQREPVVAGQLTIGRDQACNLVLSDPQVARRHLTLSCDGGSTVSLAPSGPDFSIRVDGEPIEVGALVGLDQVIRIGASTLAIRRQTSPVAPTSGEIGDVAFHRTPYYPSPVEPITIEPLGEVPDRAEAVPFAYLAALAPLVLGVGLALVYSPRFLIFAVFSPVIAIAGYFDQRRRARRRFGRSETRFREQLQQRCADVRLAIASERDRRALGGPDLALLAERATSHRVELWVRDRRARDFLTLRVGVGSVVPLVNVRPETRGSEVLRDEANEHIRRELSMRDVPITLDLIGTAIVAVVGDDRDVTPLATSLVAQACCLHSPEDLVGVALVAECRAMTEWLNWLPHLRSANSPLAGPHIATDQSSADRLLKELLVVAERRTTPLDGGSDGPWPRLLVLVDRRLELEPSLVSRLLDLTPEAGFTVVWLTPSEDRVPRQAGAVVSCRSLVSSTPSRLSFTDPGRDDQSLVAERLTAGTATVIARSLAPLRDASSATSSSALPRTVSLKDALQVTDIDDDWVMRQWRIDRGDRLPATIGVTANGPLNLDLVANGPHGLIGGTSGAGKSELLISMVAGMIALNPPDRLNVLFIDYKGGAATDVFRNAPHTVGCVTNLDEALARRALTSLRAELTRRMNLLQGRAKDLGELLLIDPDHAPPSLVIVIDEFATLVNEVPDFMRGIVDLAQRGRSLGIHLLLATQRPSGAVNENILANTNLRISLRMLDRSESLNVIGTADAAMIPPPLKGRGFARLGPGRLLPFQTAWSGAPLQAAKGRPPIAVTALGSAESTPASSPGCTLRAVESTTTQLDQLLASIHSAAHRLRLGSARSPWLDALPSCLPLEAVRVAADPAPGPSPSGLVVPIGLIDDPGAQAQYPAAIDFEADGGLLVFGAAGSGKTTVLRTLALSAALDDHERGGETLTIFGLDFASRHLTVLAALPQCSAIATADDLEAVTRIVIVLEAEVERRLGSVSGAARRGDQAPDFENILLLIDDYGALAQTFEGPGSSAGLYSWLERVNRLIVDGRQVGLYTAATVSRPAAARGPVRAAISKRLVLKQADAGAYADLDLSAGLVADVDLAPGRGFFTGGQLCQVAFPGASDDQADAPADAVTAEASGPAQQRTIRSLAPTLKGMVGPGLSTEPLPFSFAPEAPTGRTLSAVIGLADLSLDSVEIDLSDSDLAVVGEPRSGRSNALALVTEHLAANGSAVWLASPASSPPAVGGAVSRRATGRPADLLTFFEELSAALERGERPVLVVDDVDLLDDPILEAPLARVLQQGVRFVASACGFRGYSTSPLVQAMKKSRNVLVLRPASPQEVQDAAGVVVGLRPGLAMGPGRGVLVVNRLSTVVQLPKYF